MTTHIASVLLAAKILSGGMLLILLGVLANLWRREGVPEFSYGSVTLSQKRLRWVWFLFLVGALGVGVNGNLVVQRTLSFEDPVNESGAPWEGIQTQSSVILPLPFYRYERNRTYLGGHLVEEDVLEGVLVPWPLIWALVAYYLLVIRWNPRNRWALRILEGRRR